MKNLLTYKLLLLTLFSVPTTVLAHPGHIGNDSAHGFLHVEHIIMLAAVALTVYLIKVFNDK